MSEKERTLNKQNSKISNSVNSENEGIGFQFVVPIDEQIITNINKILRKYNIKLERTEFNLTSKFTTNELRRLEMEVGKYNNFIIQYEKLSINNEKIKIKIKSKELNEMKMEIEEVLNIKELILLDLKKTNLNDEEKNELFNELEKLFKNYKTKKKAHQLVSIIYTKLYMNINQNEGTNVGYFYLNNKSDDMEFKKLHIREKVDLSEKIMTNQMKLLYKIFDIDISKYQPDNYHGKSENNQFNYSFNSSQYQILSILIRLLKKYPLPTTPNNIDYINAINESISKSNAQEFEDFLKLGIKEVKDIEFRKLKKILDTDFSFQTMKRLAAESDILEKKLITFFNAVKESNFYENVILYQKLSSAIERVLFEHQDEKENYNKFINSLRSNDDSIITCDNNVVSRYQSLKELILSGKSGDFNALYDEFINYSSIAHKHEITEEETNSMNTSPHTSINIKEVFIDKYNFKIPFIDQILLKSLQSDNKKFLDARNLYLKEYLAHSSLENSISSTQSFIPDREIQEGINHLNQAIDHLGLQLLKKDIRNHNQYTSYTHPFLKELRRMKRQVSIFNRDSINRKSRTTNEIYNYKPKNTNIFTDRISELVKELMYLKIKKELYNSSKYTD
ncbi:DUF6038 family protein [Staphylococcus hominis]|uniref:DUF6038 family protein n=1 Tax=Staphylococcus hominis TaxID=1290 RepID=UPI00301914E5